MEEVGSFSGESLLRQPVTLHGIRLGHPVDLLLDAADRRVLGLVVLCGDDSQRFLPWAAMQPDEAETRVASSLVLLEDVGFYRSRADSFRELLGGVVRSRGVDVGGLQDLELERDGTVGVVVAVRGGAEQRLPAQDTSLSSERAAA